MALETQTTITLMTTSFAAVGWLINHVITSRQHRKRGQLEAQQKYLERQIEELYGPLASALFEGRRTYLDLLDTLGRETVFIGEELLSESDLATWLFWAEADFLPRNEFIKTLLKTKAHLIEGSTFPESHIEFLDHCNSWAINHRRWKEEKVPYSWHSKINWPDDFERDVLLTAQSLKNRQAELLGQLTLTKPL
ncbi:hypothetical protein [Herbaspirillum huttiense]|uniref:hypothetical protein n=1 Tax=Herbaspirillum huttiense TaxID=863372 RepID=UPI0039AF9C80